MEERIAIVVRPHGHVYVGYYREEGLGFVLRHSRTIRVWGTSRGLGELVNGPTAETKLDDAFPETRGAIVSSVAVHAVNQDAWAPHLKAQA